MNWTIIAISFLCGSQIGLLYFMTKLAKALFHTRAQLEADMRMVKTITDTLANQNLKLAQQHTETMKVIRVLQFLNGDEKTVAE